MKTVTTDFGFAMSYGVRPFTPATTCRETRCARIKPGSPLCCAVCHRSGVDHHPQLHRNPADDPKPDPPAPALAVPSKKQKKKKLRKEIRAARYAQLGIRDAA